MHAALSISQFAIVMMAMVGFLLLSADVLSAGDVGSVADAASSVLQAAKERIGPG